MKTLLPALPSLLLFAGACGTANGTTNDCPSCPDQAGPIPTAIERPVATSVALDDLQSAFQKAIRQAAPSVVSVYSTKTIAARARRGPLGNDPLFDFFFHRPQPQQRDFQRQGLGSGFIIDESGYILTNNHVVEDADEVKVKLHDDREIQAEVVGTDPPTDLALLRIEAEDLDPIELGDSDALEVGDWVLAIGNPFGLPQTVSSGIVSAKGRGNVGIVDYENFIQTDAAVNPGNSGGPLVDLNGRVIGINTAIASRSGGNNGIAFAIPVNMAKNIVQQLRGSGKVVRGFLGILISELSPEMAATFDYEGTDGILVQEVHGESPAEKAGLQDGDIITKLDGETVASVQDFRSKVAAKSPGATVNIEVWRDKKTLRLSPELAEAPSSGSAGVIAKEPQKIGISLSDITPQLRRQFSLETAKGVVITDVAPGSPAARAGIQAGDVLTQIGRTEVSSASQAIKILRNSELEKGVRLRLIHDGRGRFVLLKVKP